MSVLRFEQCSEPMLAAAFERLGKARVSDVDEKVDAGRGSETCQKIVGQAIHFLATDPKANLPGVLAAMLCVGIEIGLNAHGEG